MSTKIFILPKAFVSCLLLLLAFVSCAATGCKPPLDPRVGTLAPAFEGKTLNGNTFTFDGKGDGKVYFLEFWATWCSPCDQQARYYIQFEQNHANDGDVEVVKINADGVSKDEQLKAVEAYLNARGLMWDPILDQGKLKNLFEVQSFPTTVAIGKDGRFIFANAGLLQLDHLDAILDYARNPEPIADTGK